MPSLRSINLRERSGADAFIKSRRSAQSGMMAAALRSCGCGFFLGAGLVKAPYCACGDRAGKSATFERGRAVLTRDVVARPASPKR